jgi:hypothetical protein
LKAELRNSIIFSIFGVLGIIFFFGLWRRRAARKNIQKKKEDVA